MTFPYDSLFLTDNKRDLDTYPKRAAINKVLAPEWNALVKGVNAIATAAFTNGMAVTNLAPSGATTTGQPLVFNAVTNKWEPGAVTPSSSSVGTIAVTDVTVDGGIASSKIYDDPANSILQSCTVSGSNVNIFVKASYPHVIIGGVAAIIAPVTGGLYVGSVAVVIAGSGVITAQVVSPDGEAGATDDIMLVVDAAPEILTLTFTGGYPGIQTELKAGDTFQVSGTTSSAAVGVEVIDFGAGISQLITFASATNFTVTITIANRGDTPQALVARMKARNVAGAYGATHDTSNTVILNDLHPTVTFGAKGYPVGQLALKNAETATVGVTLANLDTVLFDSPNGDISITNPTLIEATKTVTRINGSYNISTNNLRGTATRSANAAQTTAQTIINIANVATLIDVTYLAARLRSGGNNGTVIQGHIITITSSQQLYSVPSMSAGSGGGTFIGSWIGGPLIYTRTLNIHDDLVKGGYTFNTLVATGLAGIVQNTINSGASYTLGGFVARDLTFGSYSQTTALNVACVDYTKLQAGIFTASDHQAQKNTLPGNHDDIVDTYTVDAINTNPTSIWWNDVIRAGTNSGGTAKILSVEEVP